MNPTVYDFAHTGPAPPLADIYQPAAFQSPELVIAAGAVGALLLFIRMRHRDVVNGTFVDHITSGWPYLLMIAMYHCYWNHVDEVAIALEHAFNLRNFGRFSYAPDRMVDGTVEVAYFLLLTPFAWSAQSVVFANFFLGLIVALAHLYVLSRLIGRESPIARTAILLLFSLNYPIVAQLSGGFGNSLVTLGMLIAIERHCSGRRVAATIVASCLPVLRPDAVLYSVALLLAFEDRTVKAWLVRCLARAFLPLAATALYLGLFYLVYGHWIPTPIAFKSPPPGAVGLAQLRLVTGIILSSIALPHAIGLAAMLVAVRWRDDRRIATLLRLFVPMAAIYVFYLMAGSDRDATGINAARYWLGFDVLLALFTSVVLANLLAETRGRYPVAAQVLVPAIVVTCAIAATVWNSSTVSSNRSELGFAGQIVAAALPPELSLATTELNSFGLAVPDREVIDLWGYTRPEIARSPLRDLEMNRYEPNLFRTLTPDVFFVYEMESTAAAESQLSGVSWRHGVARLGDMNWMLSEYDVVGLTHPQQTVVLLVRRDSLGTVRQSLNAKGYRQTRQRPLDMQLFRNYDQQMRGVL
jgi:hypothetical protein